MVHSVCSTKSVVPLDGETVRKLGQDFRIVFGDLFHAGHARTAPQLGFQCLELGLTSDGVYFNASIEKILCVSGDPWPHRDLFRKKAKTRALHGARHVKSLGQSL